MRHVYVLLSGGLDSSTALYLARRENPDAQLHAISVNYGQRHVRELNAAMDVIDALDNFTNDTVTRHDLDLKNVIPHSVLTDNQAELPNISYNEIEGVSPAYVPFRNGMMLSAAAGLAHADSADDCEESGEASLLYFGAHAEDARNWAYPDCSPEFIGAMANAIFVGTYMHVRLVAPFIHMTKAHIVRLGHELFVPFEMTWSCYAGGDKHCGVCPTCRARKDAFLEGEFVDPTVYAA